MLSCQNILFIREFKTNNLLNISQKKVNLERFNIINIFYFRKIYIGI